MYIILIAAIIIAVVVYVWARTCKDIPVCKNELTFLSYEFLFLALLAAFGIWIAIKYAPN